MLTEIKVGYKYKGLVNGAIFTVTDIKSDAGEKYVYLSCSNNGKLVVPYNRFAHSLIEEVK